MSRSSSRGESRDLSLPYLLHLPSQSSRPTATMPVHLLPYLLSSGTSISVIHPNLVAAIAFILIVLVLRRWSNGKDLITRLYLREQEKEEERQKLRGKRGKAEEFTRRREVERDLHGLTFLVVVSEGRCRERSATYD